MVIPAIIKGGKYSDERGSLFLTITLMFRQLKEYTVSKIKIQIL
jgi:hypothetical protein